MKAKFKIDGIEKEVSIDSTQVFKCGKDEILSDIDTDISYEQPWYNEGFTEIDFLTNEEYVFLRNGLIGSIGEIIKKELPLVDLTGFSLENYHNYIQTDAEHFKIVSKTRDLFSHDFNFPIEKYLPKLEDVLNLKLTDVDPFNNKKVHIIVRINRPLSADYNPPHKDIYEGVDNDDYIPQFMNFWIPVAGVTENTSLPIVPQSHRINENLISRTFQGGCASGNKYRVRFIKSWNEDNSLVRSTVKYRQVLIFSSHLIHGLAINEEPNVTRVALEFRLFKG
jgi:hypothetical protein